MMKKGNTVMKTNRIMSLAVLALTMAACTSDEISPSQSVNSAGKGIPFSATITTGTATRALVESNAQLQAAWALGEEVALVHDNVVDTMVVDTIDAETNTVFISGTVTGEPADGTDVTVVYPASAVDVTTLAVKEDLLAAQDGTLEEISKNLDLCQTNTTLTVAAGHASLNGTAVLENQLAIVKFALSDGTDEVKTTELVIKDGSDNVLTTVKTADADSKFYVAMAPSQDATYGFEATANGGVYTYYKENVTLEAGKYYQSPLTMTPPPVDVTGVTLDKTELELVIGATETLKATVAPDDADDKTVTWSTSDATIATVDTDGNVTAVAAGTAIITVTATNGTEETDDDQNATCTVTVNKKAGSISYEVIEVKKADGAEDFTNALTKTGDGTVTYTSSDEKVATVDADGKVTIVNAGTATITATVADSDTYTYDPRVASYKLTVDPRKDPKLDTLDPFDNGGDPLQ